VGVIKQKRGPIGLKALEASTRITVERAKSRAIWITAGGNKYLILLDHILLDRLEKMAPGTLRHSFMVANIAAAAAFHIEGVDPDLVRCIATFHDIAKGEHPEYFIEALSGRRDVDEQQRSQIEIKSLEELDFIMSHPDESARILEEYGFPPEVCQAVREHHGTLTTRLKLSAELQALIKKEPELKKKLFYHAKPTSKASAIVFLADRCEAAISRMLAEEGIMYPGQDFIENKVKLLGVDAREKGQLDDSGLTVEEQAIVEEKITWWLYRYYNDLDITGTPPPAQIAAAESRHNHSGPQSFEN
ncbi:MAG TPA: HDIG domain-containing protein, partial [Candidatus Sulfotelmatobacter sp.]|nr:HDIG domain-containing protein [Candidatus Sulfotelmatobacter sp.]